MTPRTPATLLFLAFFVPLASAAAPQTPSAAMPSPRSFATVAITNPRSLAVDPAGNLYVGDVDGGKIFKITPAGQATAIGIGGASTIGDPIGFCLGQDGALYVADADGNMIYKISPGAPATPMAKPDAAASFKTPTGVAVDSKSNVFVTNNMDNSILKITPAGVVSIFAGKSATPGAADGAAPDATFMTPRGIAIDGKDNLYVADEGNSNIRKITPAGVVTTLAGKAGETGSADGAGAAARFAAPRALAAAADGTVYVADTDNALIRKISPDGAVTTLAGKAGDVGNADGPGPTARFSEPRAITVAASGNVYVADTGNATIRQITPTGTVTTIAAATKP